jgi:sulfite reductase (NADPH) flavoprotein alpha-component
VNAFTPPPAVTPVIPENAPFSAEQRAWLNGFFAGLFSQEAPGVTALASPDALPQGAGRDSLADGDDGEAPWHDQTLPLKQRMLLAEGRPLRRRMMAAMAQQDCGQCGSSCEEYSNSIALQAEDRLNLCAPGGKETARMLKALVEEMGGGAIDPDEAKAKAEAKATEAADLADARPGRSRAHPIEATLIARYRLNREGSEKETFHVEFDLTESGLDYEPGDSFGIFAKNNPALVDEVLGAIGAPADFPIAGKPLRDVLIDDMALGVAPDALFDFISYLAGGERRQKAKALAKGEDPDGDAAHLDVLGALLKFPGLRPDPEAFIESLEPLQPRLYSISSSHRAGPGRVSLTVDKVQYDLAGRTRHGVASTFVGDRLPVGERLKVYVQKAHSFALPPNDATPIIMVGPGTGVAPFRAFLHERMARKAQGRAWLFYGHQRAATDFFYEDEMAGLQSCGALTQLSLAWSRDGAQKVYVQDRMREHAADLWSWLREGAHFYVCGDAKRMAADVEKALIDVAAVQGALDAEAARAFVQDLKKAGRYQADVY